MTMEISELLYEILAFTNNPTKDDVIIESCVDYSEKLDNYFIVLHREKFPAMEMFLQEVFPKYREIIQSSFRAEEDSEEQVLQCCKTYYPDNLTEKFVDKYGCIDNLVKYGPMGLINSTEESDEVEEDEEMIQELKDEVNNLAEQLELASKALEEKDVELSYYKSKYPSDELDDEILIAFMDILEKESPELTRDAIRDAIMSSVDEDDEKEVSRIIGIVLEQYVKYERVQEILGLNSEEDDLSEQTK